MESWQRQHIHKNLSNLISNTKCTTKFKAILREKELISDEEDQKLSAKETNEGSFCASKYLFEIIVTRTNGYTGLIEALKETRQTGAWNILKNGLSNQPTSALESVDTVTNKHSFAKTCISVTTAGIVIRSKPCIDASVVGSLAPETTINVLEKVSGTEVNGIAYWYKLSNGYVSANYVSLSDKPRISKESSCGVTTAGVPIRSSPNTSASIVGSLREGATINIVGRVKGTNVNGNTTWLKVSNGFISAFYVKLS